MKKISVLFAVGTLAALSGFAAVATAQESATAEAAPADSAEATPELLPDIVLGDKDAPVTIYEYASFTCGHCAQFHAETFPKLKEELIDTGRANFVQRDVYFDAVGMWAGILARCGGDEKFFPISAMLFEEQRDWMDGKTGEDIAANLRKIGARAGLSPDQMEACWADEKMVERMVYTFQHNAGGDEIKATPTLVVNGEQISNQSWDKLKPLIEEQIEAATQ